MLSKLMGGAIVLFYLLTEKLPIQQDFGFWIWFALLVRVILAIDYILGKLISDPLGRINGTAKQMAAFDFTTIAWVTTGEQRNLFLFPVCVPV